jgi:hypothetical protein
MMQPEPASEMVVLDSDFTWLIMWEDFMAFVGHKSFKSYRGKFWITIYDYSGSETDIYFGFIQF